MFVQFADSSARAQYFIRRRVFHIMMETTDTKKFPLRISARVTEGSFFFLLLFRDNVLSSAFTTL